MAAHVLSIGDICLQGNLQNYKTCSSSNLQHKPSMRRYLEGDLTPTSPLTLMSYVQYATEGAKWPTGS